MNNFDKIGIILLAAGKGTRLNCDAVPKVLCRIGNKPMISYVLEEFEKNGINKSQICIVVGYKIVLKENGSARIILY